MRFVVFVKASKESETGVMPKPEEFAEMGKFNEELVKAGIMLAGEGLHPTSKAARIRFSGKGNAEVIPGPFPGAPENLVAGYWLLKAKSREEVLEWMKRAPFERGEIEIRQIFEAEDFGDALPQEVREQEDRLREQAKKN
jgi:hypothetical protein